MPLNNSKSKQAFRENVAAEINAGRPPKQAVAIAYSAQRRAPKGYAGGGRAQGVLNYIKDFWSRNSGDSTMRVEGKNVISRDPLSLLNFIEDSGKALDLPFRAVSDPVFDLTGSPAAATAAYTAAQMPGMAASGVKAAVKGAKAVAKDAPRLLSNAADKVVNASPLSQMMLDPRMFVIKPKGGNWANVELHKDLFDPGMAGAFAGAHEGETLPTHIPASGLGMTIDSMIGRFGGTAAAEGWINKQFKRYLMTNFGTENDPFSDYLVQKAREGRLNWGSEDGLTIQHDIERFLGQGDFRYNARHPSVSNKPDQRDFFTGASLNPYRLSEADHDIKSNLKSWFGRDESGSPRALYRIRNPISIDPEVLRHSTKHMQDPEHPELTTPAGKIGVDDHAAEFLRQLDDNGLIERMPNLTGGELKHPDWYKNLKTGDWLYDYDVGPGSLGDMIEPEMNMVSDYMNTLRPEQIKGLSVPDMFKQADRWHQQFAKKMTAQRAQVASNVLPVHKEYPSGFKWIELAKPDALPEDAQKYVRRSGDKWVAIDHEGAPIRRKDVYGQGQTAYGNTPEEAFLAGALSDESNNMGHCIAGYCDKIIAGKSQNFSLRDPEGQSHVTVEVMPPAKPVQHKPDMSMMWNRLLEGLDMNTDEGLDQFGKRYNEFNQMAGGRPMDEALQAGNALLQKYGKEPFPLEGWTEYFKPSIMQIKGKQNLKPKDQYIPYVQNFIRSQPWESIGELHNADMVQLQSSNLSNAVARNSNRSVGSDNLWAKEDLKNILKRYWSEGMQEVRTSKTVTPPSFSQGYYDVVKPPPYKQLGPSRVLPKTALEELGWRGLDATQQPHVLDLDKFPLLRDRDSAEAGIEASGYPNVGSLMREPDFEAVASNPSAYIRLVRDALDWHNKLPDNPGPTGFAKGGSVTSNIYKELMPVFSELEERFGLPKNLLYAVSHTESSGNPKAVSPKGAKGLFQFMDGTAKRYNLTDPFDPVESTYAGASYLRDLYRKFKGNLDKTLAGYNWGEHNVEKSSLDKMPKETQDYLVKVRHKMDLGTPTLEHGDGDKGLPNIAEQLMMAQAPAAEEDNEMTPTDRYLLLSLIDQLDGGDEEIA